MQPSTRLPLLVALLAAACGSGDGPPAGGDVDACLADPALCGGGDGATDARDPACPATATWVPRVTGNVVDESGAPIGDAKVQLCVREAINSRLLCLSPVDSMADGTYSARVATAARCMESAVMRVLVPLTDRATTYCDLSLPQSDGELDVADPFVLYATQPAVVPTLNGGGNVHTVTFPGDLQVDVIPDDLVGEYALLAGRSLDPAVVRPCFLDAGTSLTALFAFSPEASVLGAGFDFRLPNSFGLAANTELQLYILGGLGCYVGGELVHEGSWFPYGLGSVSSDGTQITGAPLPCLGFWGFGPR